jgi:chaperone BCS1
MSKDWREVLTIRMFTRDPEHLRAFVREIADLSREPEDTQIGVYAPHGDYWARIQSRSKRALESVILPDGQAGRLLRDCQYFLENEERYELLGLNHRRGYLFHGVPGSGKTSLVVGLASALGKDVYYLSLGGTSFSDERLLGLLSRVDDGAIVLLEDVDALFVGREKTTTGGLTDTLTFSGLLNALDGVASASGTMLFMTTNHLEKLDPALVRPGRVDVRVEFTHATYGQALELYRRFFPEADAVEAESFARWGGDGAHSMAELQEALIEQWLVDPEPAMEPVPALAAAATVGSDG